MRKTMVAIAATTALAGGTLMTGTPTSASPANGQGLAACVSQAEYQAVKPGMPRSKVKQVLGGQAPYLTDELRRAWYRPCGTWTVGLFPTVTYTAAGKVKSKALKAGGSVSRS
jgi:hypothetical protein